MTFWIDNKINATPLTQTVCWVKLCVSMLAMTFILTSCASVDPANVDVELPQSTPIAKTTSYTQSLAQLGLMTEIYSTGPLKIQSNPIGDNTGTAQSTGGEIPRDITEIIKSSLNSIGGNVIFIPYDPAFIQNQMVTGYSNFEAKLIPDVVISGGITEFDRGLETRGDGTDVGAEAEFTGMKDWLPSKQVAVEYSDSSKTGLARITLDFNLLDFKTMAGIARMNTVNSMEVSKAMSNKEFGITIFGPTFGRKGSIKKVQGRHGAIRLLVELSMIQIVGKHLVLPYWRLLGDDNEADPVVVSALSRSYYNMDEVSRTVAIQEWLYLHGHNISVTGSMNQETIQAIKSFAPNFTGNTPVSEELFIEIYSTIPVNQKTLARRNELNRSYMEPQPQPEPYIEEPAPAKTTYAETALQPAQESAPQIEESTQQAESSKQAPKKTYVPTKRTSIGRILSDEEW